jgi:hypothetical protein
MPPTYQTFLSTLSHPTPPASLPLTLAALWYCKNNQWETAHNIAQDIHTPTGSWIHALLHLIEGDTANAAYWFHQAHQPVRTIQEIDQEWQNIVQTLCHRAN